MSLSNEVEIRSLATPEFFLEEPPNFSPMMHVSLCFCEYDSKIVLLLRHPSKPQGNTWCAPGGKLDTGDSPLSAVIREVSEETHILLKEEQLDFRATFYTRYPSGDIALYVYHALLTELPSLSVNPGEHEKICLISPKDAMNLALMPGADQLIEFIYGKQV